jgi:predicted RNase H-like HicB family nuclease
LHRKAHAAEDAPDLRLPELDTVQPLDEHAHALERPQLGAKAVLGGFVQQRSAQDLQLPVVQARWSFSCGHGPQLVTQGEDLEHALGEAADAMDEVVATYMQGGLSLPRPARPARVSTRCRLPPKR